MATDVVPELNAKIEASFKGNVMKDRLLSKISGRIRDGTANLKDAHDYAERLGENLSKALVNNLTQDALPNGTLYYNIAQRTIIPNLQTNYKLINEAAEMIQKSLDKKDNIGLGVVKADFPKERISGLIDKMTAEDVEYDRAVKWLAEPIVNNSEAFADDFVEANASFRQSAGLRAKVTRIAAANCCKWCSDMEGTYDYDNRPDDIFRRHENCRCVVTYQSEKISQNVWTKRTWKTSEQELERRKSAANPKGLSLDERLERIRVLERDRVISDFASETGESRRSAATATRNKSPAQIQEQINRIKEKRRKAQRR